jgi:hypothetical protein
MLRYSVGALIVRLAAPYADCEVEGANVNLGFARGSKGFMRASGCRCVAVSEGRIHFARSARGLGKTHGVGPAGANSVSSPVEYQLAFF